MTGDRFPRRVDAWHDDLVVALEALYPGHVAELTHAVVARARAAAAARSPALLELDDRRDAEPDWYQQPRRAGYIAYADRFGGTLAGVRRRIPYLTELGVDVLHLMSVFAARVGEDDGGFAIDDYRTPESSLGSTDDLVELADALRDAGISLCLDLVMNHTSADHEWARLARQGSARHRARYLVFEDRTLPDAYEATLPEVFPHLAPGNFTWDDALAGWVWTTFREFQWDLAWSNPDVMLEMVDVLLHLANLGVEIVRLDAVAFTWKRLGTSCQNQPEAHAVVQALRAAVGMATPSTILLAEAIVAPDDLVAYLGRHEHDGGVVVQRRECELAYHNQLMVQGWSMLAERRVALASRALGRMPPPPTRTTWLTYVRCHDDIGWSIADADAAAVGLDGWHHRRFLAAFYRGDFWESFARGTPFAPNELTGDERTSGMTAALCGITAALEGDDARQLALGIDRLLLLYALACGYGGIPMVYMGDELGQGDDESAADDPDRAADSRWRHRPWFDDVAAGRRGDAATVAGAVFAGVRRLLAVRAGRPELHGAALVHPLDARHESVFAWQRDLGGEPVMVGLANVCEERAVADSEVLTPLGMLDLVDALAPDETQVRDLAVLAPYQVRWIVKR